MTKPLPRSMAASSGVPVLVLVVGVDEGVLLQAGQVGVGRVEGEDAARPQHAAGLGQDLLGLGPRDVLNALDRCRPCRTMPTGSC